MTAEYIKQIIETELKLESDNKNVFGLEIKLDKEELINIGLFGLFLRTYYSI